MMLTDTISLLTPLPYVIIGVKIVKNRKYCSINMLYSLIVLLYRTLGFK